MVPDIKICSNCSTFLLSVCHLSLILMGLFFLHRAPFLLSFQIIKSIVQFHDCTFITNDYIPFWDYSCFAYAKISLTFQTQEFFFFLFGHIAFSRKHPVPCLVQMSRLEDHSRCAKAADETLSGEDLYITHWAALSPKCMSLGHFWWHLMTLSWTCAAL